MKSEKPPRKESTPAIPLFGDAYMSDTRHLTLEEHGAYYLLLLIAWWTADCALPDDDKRLAQMLGISTRKWGQIKPVIMAFWDLKDGRWTQKRLTKERVYVEHKRAKNAQIARDRWNGQDTENKGSGVSERISERTSGRTSGRIYQNDTPPPLPLIPTDKSVGARAKHSLPKDWGPGEFGHGTEAAEIVASWTDDQTKRELERFADHHRAQGSKFSDWQAAWGKWVRNSVGFNRRNAEDRRPSSTRSGDLVETILAEADRARANPP